MKWRSGNPMRLALGASVLVHAVLLGTRWVNPAWMERQLTSDALEVILVNARTSERPTRAQAIAQHNMAGGGAAERGHASSPLAAADITQTGAAAQDANQRKLQNLQQQQSQLLAQIKQQLANLPPLAPQPTEPSPAQLAQEQQRQQLLKLLAQIERRIHTENARPRKRYVSPATQEAVYALYYDQLRIKIETKGTHNFPVANGQKLYGALTMLITINSDGRVLQTEVITPSGNPTLDRRAQAIVQSAAPFGAFNAAMRNQADQLLVVSTFTFNRDETLQTQFVGK